MKAAPRNTILIGDAHERLRRLPTGVIDCVITSPPYYRLRDYGVAGQLGLEPSVTAWVEQMRLVCTEISRVLKPSGSLWLNIGDTYSRHPIHGAPAKGLLLAPERLLLALAGDGWLCRNKVVRHSTNPMPSAVGDRLNNTYDLIYLLVRQPDYFFDLDAVRDPLPEGADISGADWLGRNPGDVWRIAPARHGSVHFATFPPALVERPLLATCPERVCRSCGQAWRRRPGEEQVIGRRSAPDSTDRYVRRYRSHWRVARRLGELTPGCRCGAPTQPGLVLDPFFGTGTVGLVAAQHGRDWLGIELSAVYTAIAEDRLGLQKAEAA